MRSKWVLSVLTRAEVNSSNILLGLSGDAVDVGTSTSREVNKLGRKSLMICVRRWWVVAAGVPGGEEKGENL